MRESVRGCLFLFATVLMFFSLGSSRLSSAAKLDDTFSLSVTIQSRHISHFEACIPVRVNEPFKVTWGTDEVKDSFSGVLRPPKKGEYPIEFNISEGAGNCREFTVPSFTLDKPYEWSNIVSLTFKHIDSRKVVLSKTPCQ